MSNAPASVAADARMRYERDGFLIARRVFAADRVAALAGDAERLLQREHALLIASIGLIANGRIVLDGADPAFDGRLLAAPLGLADDGSLSPQPA